MGMPLPGAIAAHMVHPGRKIFGIAGDGDFMMNVQEMETARRLDADITLMVWEDGGYGLIAWKQDTEFGRHTDLGSRSEEQPSELQSLIRIPYAVFCLQKKKNNTHR